MFEIQDLINGSFELLGAVVIWLNVLQIRKDRVVLGYNPYVTWFFASWGAWNIYYYDYLNQILSWFGGIAIVFVHIIWLYHVYWYKHKHRWKLRNAITLDIKTSMFGVESVQKIPEAGGLKIIVNKTLHDVNGFANWIIPINRRYDVNKLTSVSVLGKEFDAGPLEVFDYEIIPEENSILVKWLPPTTLITEQKTIEVLDKVRELEMELTIVEPHYLRVR